MMSSSRRFSLDYHVKVGAHDAYLDLWLPAPRTDAYQEVVSEVVSSPASLSMGEDELEGNRILYGRLPASREAQHIVVRHRIDRVARRAPPLPAALHSASTVQPELARFLCANSRVPVDGVVAEMSREISQSAPPMERARQVFQNLLASLDYDSRGCTPERAHELGDLVLACDLKRGTCTEFHGLYVAHARALGIPARFSFGFNIPRKAEGKIAGYHCWAEVYLLEIGWWAVDVSEAWKRSDPSERGFYFGNLDADRVQFTTGRDVSLIPPPITGVVDSFIFPLAEMEGRRVDVDLEFSFVNA